MVVANVIYFWLVAAAVTVVACSRCRLPVARAKTRMKNKKKQTKSYNRL